MWFVVVQVLLVSSQPDSWEIKTPMSLPRTEFATAALDDEIFVIGGLTLVVTLRFVSNERKNKIPSMVGLMELWLLWKSIIR